MFEVFVFSSGTEASVIAYNEGFVFFLSAHSWYVCVCVCYSLEIVDISRKEFSKQINLFTVVFKMLRVNRYWIAAWSSLFWIIFNRWLSSCLSKTQCETPWRNNPSNTCSPQPNTSIWRLFFWFFRHVFESAASLRSALFVYGQWSAVTLLSERSARRGLSVTSSQHNIHRRTAASVTGTPLTASRVVQSADLGPVQHQVSLITHVI